MQGFDLAALKQSSRRSLHGVAAVAAVYTDAAWPDGVAVKVRWHNKASAASIADNQAAIFENVNRLVFSADNLAANDQRGEIILQAGARVTIPGYGLLLDLDTELPPDGPLNVYWSVTGGHV